MIVFLLIRKKKNLESWIRACIHNFVKCVQVRTKSPGILLESFVIVYKVKLLYCPEKLFNSTPVKGQLTRDDIILPNQISELRTQRPRGNPQHSVFLPAPSIVTEFRICCSPFSSPTPRETSSSNGNSKLLRAFCFCPIHTQFTQNLFFFFLLSWCSDPFEFFILNFNFILILIIFAGIGVIE